MNKRKKHVDKRNGFGEWGGYMDAKVSKLEQQFSEGATKSNTQNNLFAGISIFVNGLTDPSSDQLKRIMMTNGGVYHTYQRSSTTFVIASNLPDVKIRQITSDKIISPQWIVDCVKENRILDYAKYLLYTNSKSNQPRINFRKDEPKLGGVKDELNDLTAVGVTNENCEVEEKVKVENLDLSLVENLKTLNAQIIEAFSNNKVEPQEVGAEIFFINPVLETVDSNKTKLRTADDNLKVEPLSNPTIGTVDANKSKVRTAVDPLEVEPFVNPAQETADPNKSKVRTAVDPNFLTEFYNNSRLHHIATLGAGFKSYINELREKHDGTFPDRDVLQSLIDPNNLQEAFSGAKTTIMHIDMDCFFVSVGLRSRPHLKGLPIAVTHSKGGATTTVNPNADRQKEIELYTKRLDSKVKDNILVSDTRFHSIDSTDSLSEIASCSYEARKMGVKNGMFVGAALKLCPNLKTIPYDFDGYKEVANTLYSTIAKYTLNIEAVSCDEMYVDLSELLESTKISVEDFVTFVRKEIQTKTECPCSAGIGGNRLQARMATKKAKPNGQFYLQAEQVEEYFRDIEISEFPGVGYSTTHKLNQLQLHKCEDLLTVSLAKLQMEFGKKFGETLYQYCRGIDKKPLVYGQIRKSVSAEVNYGIRFTMHAEFDTFLRQLCHEVHNRLMECKQRGKSITLKLMTRATDAPKETAKFMGHGYCDHMTKTHSLADFTCDLDVIEKAVFAIKQSLQIEPSDLRGIGIQISKFDQNDENVVRPNKLKEMFSKVAEKNLLIKADTSENPKNEGILRNKNDVPKPTVVQRPATITRGRGRGRGRGISRMPAANQSILNMLQAEAPQPRPNDNYEELDMKVLDELPADIREEVLREYNLNRKQKTVTPKKSETPVDGMDEEFLAALPQSIREEILRDHRQHLENAVKRIDVSTSTNATMTSSEQGKEATAYCPVERVIAETYPSTASPPPPAPPPPQPPQPDGISKSNLLYQNDWKTVLESWLQSTASPESCDVDILSGFAIEMIKQSLLNELYLRLRFLFRKIDELHNCKWHSGYRQIIDILQTEMIAKYKSRLHVKMDFNCANSCGGERK